MTVTNDDLLNAMENSFFAFPEVPGKLERFSFDGIQALWSPVSDSFHGNAVGNVRLNSENVDSTIQQIHQFYSSRKRSYQWFIVPILATPENLGKRLVAGGVPKAGEAAGLFTTNFDLAVKINPAITVREVTGDDENDLIDMIVRGFPMPEEIANVMVSIMDAVSARRYVAYLDGEPISGAVMFYMSDTPIVMFQGAATLKEHRGKGAYSALLQRRLQDAKADGMEAAVLQADRSTSAPICAKYGFQELCGIEFYVWMHEGLSAH